MASELETSIILLSLLNYLSLVLSCHFHIEVSQAGHRIRCEVDILLLKLLGPLNGVFLNIRIALIVDRLNEAVILVSVVLIHFLKQFHVLRVMTKDGWSIPHQEELVN